MKTHTTLFLDGEWVPSQGSGRIDVISPWTEEITGTVPAATTGDVDRAVAAARRAFDDGRWARTELAERIAVLRRVREALVARRQEFAALITDEMGSPIAQSSAIQIGAPLALLDTYTELAASYPFEEIRSAASGSALVTREPVGVVAAVVPWNVPLTVTVQKLAPALLTGCTVVLKPAPETPLSVYALTELFRQAGLPAGVLNVVPAGREVSEYLVGHPGVDKVTFTGSTVAGRRIASVCGEHLKRVTLELGGKSAAVVLDDADLDSTVEALRLGSLRNSGQICTLKTRLLVSHRRHDEFVDRLRGLLASMPVGDPHDPATQIGPMVTARQRDRVAGYIRIGREEGATVVAGGGEPTQPRGWFVDPTIFTGVRPDMRIAQEEIFGPVLAVISYADEEEAIAIANNSSYGLNGAVFTQDPGHGLAVARRIRTGTVELNGNPAGFHAPFGGFKASGIGREAGREGFESYVEPKSYGLPPEFAASLNQEGKSWTTSSVS
ncbi:aldehyde dehydrogenase [Amycolatopsis acidicola]|uniref:Aldehyde dehydrogenase n=1 Tax=Amycolatopsis acidicola TaxID=2596893 RepID=A0A5N0VD25_9PSEU|nr:aldehyde dehydrogenase [Amycolatopsis acidicola]KAA9163263.1 aldehyde dehydrogenase [Amycolatopsis acidicola]